MKNFIPPPKRTQTKRLFNDRGSAIGLVALDGSERVFTLTGTPSQPGTKKHAARVAAVKKLLHGEDN